ncbi:Zinc finger C3HC4 type (RING finger) family protein [Babesia bovis T2Bo]|uniref:RING-type domain-containing protein n=1 Tax=Babesia bovis TaxID=5865 RepID=A7AWU0_BABBO|nr:Zinc finger C3HC4 type (RING finger) family protein [Babesia bovis T2Bo]EDO05518.1 Zinc finger C3HC4 type (RING finger) family protein [Babesia bovis T2Bo]|eukprot:XP_001609086.1 hypothetical protein [Babesia bovis T2Bo]
MDEYVLNNFDWSPYSNQARSRFIGGSNGVLQSSGFNNLVTAAVVCGIVAWALRLWMEFRSLHHVQKQMSTVPKILHLKGMAEFAGDLVTLTHEHFSAVVKLRHNLSPLPVPRIHMPATIIASSIHVELDGTSEDSPLDPMSDSEPTSMYPSNLDNLCVSFNMDCNRTTFVSAHWGVPVSVLQKICVGTREAQVERPNEKFSLKRFFRSLLYPNYDDGYQGLLDYDESVVLDSPDDRDERFGRFSALAHADKLCTSEAVCYSAGEGVRCKVTPPVKAFSVDGFHRSVWEILLERRYNGEEIIPLVIVLYSPRNHDTRVFVEGNVESYQGIAELTMVGFVGRLGLRERLPRSFGSAAGVSVDFSRQVCFSNDFRNPQEPRDMFGMGDDADTDCLICLSNRMDTVLLPCGHASFCYTCLQSLRTEKCPVCRGSFTSYIKFPLVRNSS